ncbi:MAG: transcriptional repressor LexA [Pseudomonadota bacterium]
MNISLKENERRVLDFFQKFHCEYQQGPTVSEIANALGQSRSLTHRYIHSLIDKGYLEQEQTGWRGVRLANSDYIQTRIPILGTIAAGRPIETMEDNASLDMATHFAGPDRYALKIRGESMVGAGILDGDTVIIQKQNHAREGEIVVALIDKHEATLKRLGKVGETIELLPENVDMEAMQYEANRITIQGVLVGMLRSY